jgi:hypothetical protein
MAFQPRESLKSGYPAPGAKAIARRILLEVLFAACATAVFVVSRGRWRASKRNSLALGYWSERSDLDVTIYSRTNAPLGRPVLFLWKLFRRTGEWAAYTERDLAWGSFANPFELARDPKLSRLAGPRAATGAEGFVFLRRMLGSDAYLRAADRRRKWEFHRRALEESLGIRCVQPYPGFLDDLDRFLAPAPVAAGYAPQLALEPHRWLVGAIAANDVLEGRLREFDPELVSVAAAQVDWEIWGLLGQVRLRRNRRDVVEHMENLGRLFPEGHPALPKIRRYRDYINNI